MSVTVAPHRVTGENTLLAACDTCDEATYLAADHRYEMRDAVTYLERLGWRVDGPPYAPGTTVCPRHQETP